MSTRIPLDGKILGFGPMLPLVAAGIGVWTLPGTWPLIAIQCAVVWGALILAFVAGVRRGYGFGDPAASKPVEIAAAMAYFSIAGLSLIVPRASIALALLAAGYAFVALLDRRAGRRGNAPAYFATLRGPQFLLGCAGLAACWAWLMH
ncbi:DUF3429 domain-containing protein [Sphingomonas sp. HHU CXW]|uniref:DUF3429 domain-containing protein n=1 Tax=Sphingomonas hominis TaxID=2741495 RepID=A0ABX2JER2_9SPHN|nr:DUF3429 domain-containing protein [Sphingomonas hominis]NTS63886.1 DUF3429 domain-containing protein [Sphingomonas hominis]